MAGAKPHFSPHAAYASASASDSTASDFTVSADADIIVFRLLLPRAFGDEDAFHLYDAIVPLRRHTAALQVRVDALEGYPEDSASRVAVVLGPTSPSRRVEVSSSGEAVELSPVQEALVALVDIEGVLHRVVGRGPELVMCLVLIEAARLDVLGRRSLGAIASESGAEVRVTSWAEDAAQSVHRPEEVVESPGPYSKVQSAIICIFERMEELERNRRSTFGKPGCSARVLVPKSQISCLVD